MPDLYLWFTEYNICIDGNGLSMTQTPSIPESSCLQDILIFLVKNWVQEGCIRLFPRNKQVTDYFGEA